MKTIELRRVESDNPDVVYFTVVNSHRGWEFGRNNSAEFKTCVGIDFASYWHPEINLCTLFCCGNDVDRDDEVLSTTNERFARLQLAVKEYNEFFASFIGPPYAKPSVDIIWGRLPVTKRLELIDRVVSNYTIISPLVVMVQWVDLRSDWRDLIKEKILSLT